MSGSRILLVAITLSSLTGAGCVSQPKGFSDSLEVIERCEGPVVLDIRNNTGQEMEIVESRIGSGARTVIAIVGTGISEVPVRRERDYSYSARPVEGGATVAISGRERPRDKAVTMKRICKSFGS